MRFFALAGWHLPEWVGLSLGQRIVILDLGAGWGAVSLAICRRIRSAADVVPGDVSTEMLTYLRAARLGHVTAKYLDATAIEAGDDTFDVVFSAFVLHLLPARAKRTSPS